MRIIAGSAKGTRLGSVPRGVRPVADRVREGLFSSLGPAVAGAAVLDLFAGTGALGIEALSRGAEHARFVDRSSPSIRAIRDNLRRCRLEARATVDQGDALAVLTRHGETPRSRYDLALADPPYDDDVVAIEEVLVALAAGALAPGGTCVITRPSRSSNLVIPLHWGVSRRLEYGDTAVLILREA